MAAFRVCNPKGVLATSGLLVLFTTDFHPLP